ncbi:TPA: chromosome partitioning protein ParB, partial [Streptococcus pyogenes]|nr:chromosome partitioning protein ParB [Streptococcus pyogenes]
ENQENLDADFEEIEDDSVLIVEAESEEELEKLYDEFVERGFKCRVSIL